MFVPTIIEKNSDNTVQMDLFSRLLLDRIVLVAGAIDGALATTITSQLLFLSSHEPDKDIYMYINSPGGETTAGFAIYDTMKYIKNDVVTISVGMAASMGAFLLAGGTNGKRYALPHSQIMLHQPLGGIQGQASDIAICAKNVLQTKNMITEILSKNTGIEKERLEIMTDRDFFITPMEAKQLGLIDHILENQDDLKAA